MLLLLSKWLSELKSASDISEAERREMQSLTRMPLGTWVQLQSVALQIAKDLKEAEGKEKVRHTTTQLVQFTLSHFFSLAGDSDH